MKSTNVEVITAAEGKKADLRASAERINQSIELIKGHEDAFEDATLEHRLIIGLEIARAQQAFGMSIQEAGKLGGRPTDQTVSRRDTVSDKPAVLSANPIGFSNWLAKEIPDLKRPTAIKYATAFWSLGLNTDATPARIKSKLKDLRHQAGKHSLPMPTLAMLYKQGKPSKDGHKRIATSPGNEPSTRVQDAREFFHIWQQQGEKLVEQGYLDALDKPGIEKLQEFNLWMRDRIKPRLKG